MKTCTRCGKKTDMPFHTCSKPFPTDEQLNLAMCEWMGWTIYEQHVGKNLPPSLEAWVNDGKPCVKCNLPNYLSDDSPRRLLNEAEARLTDEQYHTGYKQNLAVLVGLSGHMRVHSAPARARVIALLQTVKPEIFK